MLFDAGQCGALGLRRDAPHGLSVDEQQVIGAAVSSHRELADDDARAGPQVQVTTALESLSSLELLSMATRVPASAAR